MSGFDLTPPTPDIPRLRKVVEWVEEQAALPEGQREWDQEVYRKMGACGTMFCVAGKVCEDAGMVWEGPYSPYGLLDGGETSAAEGARHLLGLTQGEADLLFSARNNQTDVRRVAEDIAARAGERL